MNLYGNRKSLLALLIAGCSLIASCDAPSAPDSYVKSFGYLGKADSSAQKPVLSGLVTTENGDAEIPLAGVKVSIEGTETETDAKGRFALQTTPGTHQVEITKSGYKKLELRGYNADSTEQAHADVLLRKGKDAIVFSVGKDKIRSSNHVK